MLKLLACLILCQTVLSSHYSSSSSSSSSSSEETIINGKPDFFDERSSSEEELDCYQHVFGTCPEDNGWDTAPFMCWKEVSGNEEFNFIDAVNNGIKLAVEENNPHVKLMPVGKLRKYERLYSHKRHMFKNIGNYRVNAIKDHHGVWREWPTGTPIDFHHFPQFDPQDGQPGDTLVWYPTDHLRIASKNKKYPALYYMPKNEVCQRCPGFAPFEQECSDAGDCWRGFCACDDGYTGFKCQNSPLPWKQLVTIGGMSLGNQLSSNVEITNLIDSGFEQCNGVPEYPLQADETNVQWIATKLLSCGGLIQYEGSNSPMPSDRCYVFDRADQQWNTFHSLNCPRYRSDSIITPMGDFWIVGGTTDLQNYETLDTTELIHFDTKTDSPDHWDDGPVLPEPLFGTCLVNINDCETAVIGGIRATPPTFEASDQIYIYNWNTKLWATSPATLNVNRGSHECSKILNPAGDRWTVIIAGGLDSIGSPIDSVEAWDLMSNEVIEFQQPEKIMPAPASDFTFEAIDAYKALALIPDAGSSIVTTFTYENGWKIEHVLPGVVSSTAVFTDFRYFHCNYTVNQVIDLPFVE